MGDLLQPWHLVVLGVVAFLLFGAKRLPELGKGLGEGLKGFKEGIKGVTDPPPACTAGGAAECGSRAAGIDAGRASNRAQRLMIGSGLLARLTGAGGAGPGEISRPC
jgi:sec-independent protein translocase protein TatA